MTEIAHSIDLKLSEKLRDQAYRRKFFWAESCAQIAKQLIDLRKRRALNQKQVAEITGTKQPAISRAEQADNQSRNLNTLLSIADALDARVRVLIEPSEDILREYDDETVADTAETDEGKVESVFADSSVVTSNAPSVPVPMALEGWAYSATIRSADPLIVIGYASQGTVDPNTIRSLGLTPRTTDTANPAVALANTTTVASHVPPTARSGISGAAAFMLQR